jgi:hypothetical protein
MKMVVFSLALATLAIPALAQTDDAPRTVITKAGERVTGTILSRSETEIVIQSLSMGAVTIAAGTIESVIGPNGKPEGYVEKPDAGLFGTGLLADWNRRFEGGLTGTSGTTDSTSINTQFHADIDNPSYRSEIGAFYFLTTDNESTSVNQTRVWGTLDKKIDTGPWFVFARAQYDNDSNQVWENRLSLFGGPGYEFIKREKYELLGRVGVGYTREFGGATPPEYDDSRVEALFGLDGKWTLDTDQKVVYSVYYYPSLESLDQGRIVSSISYQADLWKAKGVGFRTGIEHTYELLTPGDDDHNNYKYFANILLKM